MHLMTIKMKNFNLDCPVQQLPLLLAIKGGGGPRPRVARMIGEPPNILSMAAGSADVAPMIDVLVELFRG